MKLFSLQTLLLLLLMTTVPTFGQTGIKWEPLFDGIEFTKVESAKPLQKICALRIDTQNRKLAFYTTGRHANFQDKTSETDRRTTVDFLKENNLLVAVNANFYSPFNAFTRVNRGPSDVLGLAVSDGVVVSLPQNGFPSFIITKEGKKEIRAVKTDESLDNIQLAVSGSALLLKDGKVLDQGDSSVHPRTAIGISANGKYVYFITIDGRQKKYSDGASLTETGKWLEKFGASEGLNLDGGGSTTMVYRDKNGEPVVLNRPVGHGNIPNSLRHNANNIGVRLRTAL